MLETAEEVTAAEDEVIEVEEHETEAPAEAHDEAPEAESDEVVVTIGEEAPPPEEVEPAPSWVKELRKQNREKERRIRELEAKLTTNTTETKPVALGAKPKLENFDYDAEQFEAAMEAWFERKRQVEAEQAKARDAEQAQQKAWKDRLDGYSKARAELKVKDYEDAEAVAQELFTVTQQGIVLQGADNPALVVYALGKNLKKAQELSQIQDPVKFAFAVAKLEKELKVTNRRAAPAPERVVSGTGRVSGAVDSTLERLRADAEKTGNYTKVLQYKRQKQSAK